MDQPGTSNQEFYNFEQEIFTVGSLESNQTESSCSNEANDNWSFRDVIKNHQGKIIHSGQKIMMYNIYIKYRNAGHVRTGSVTSAANDLGISVQSMWNTVLEMDKRGTLASPTKKRERKSTYDKLNDFQKSTLRRIVHQFFLANDVPTVDKILDKVQNNEVLPSMQRTTLYKTLTALNFVWEKRSRNHLLIEKAELIIWRRKYLNSVRNFRLQGRTIYYLDETWVNAGHTTAKVWKDQSITSAGEAFNKGLSTGLKNPSGKGKRLIILHIGNEAGFVENGLLCFESKKTSDYHEEMNSTVFEEWMERILPLLEPNCVIVMDNASYHSRRKDKRPLKSWTKSQMMEWLDAQGIPAERTELNVELFAKITNNLVGKPDCSYVIDEMVKSSGREVLRLPPYHCQFNPIELIWAQVKGYVAANNKTFKFGDMKVLFQDGLKAVTPEKWAQCVKHVVNEENFRYPVDDAVEAMQLEFQVNTGFSSDEECMPD